jgi:long-chain acyl-CoA synthetase
MSSITIINFPDEVGLTFYCDRSTFHNIQLPPLTPIPAPMPVVVSFSTIPEMFQKITERYSDEPHPMLMHKVAGKYTNYSYKEIHDRVVSFAAGLLSLGLKPGDRVGIIGENRPEWVISDQAIALIGAVSVPIYPTMSARQTEFIFHDAGVRVAIVSNLFQLNKIEKVKPAVTSLEIVIIMTEKEGVETPGALGFTVVQARGEEYLRQHPDVIELSRKTVRPSDLLTIIYTSGTTGNPKGVMLTHGNLVSNVIASASVLDFGPTDTLLSFLPLSHTFERMAGYYTVMACGVTIAYAESVDTVRDNLKEVRPTIVTTVPRLFERIHGKILKQVDASSPAKQKIFRWAIEVGREFHLARRSGGSGPLLKAKYAMAEKLVFAKLREATGGRVRYFVSGGAPLAREFGEFFEAVGITILEGYGLTESSPVITVNRLGAYKFGSVGQLIPGVEVKIAEDGEILARGPNIMKGYWKQPEATAQSIGKDGWLHTGDIGVIDAEGFLYITDRKKHLFVSTGGKNIAPQPIESLFLSSRFIEQFMLVGDRRTYLTALIVPDFDALRAYADEHRIDYGTNTELTAHPEIHALIEKDIAQIQKDLSSYERVRRFTLLDRPFTVEDGELTPTQKVRRKIVEERYSHLIEDMYRG